MDPAFTPAETGAEPEQRPPACLDAPTWAVMPEVGDLFTLAQFEGYARMGALRDDTGVGCYAMDTRVSNLRAYASATDRKHPAWATHVWWARRSFLE